MTYTVAVGTWRHTDGTPAPDHTCGHKHKSIAAAQSCGEKLYASKYVRGNWQACAAWHEWYIVDNKTGEKHHD